MNVFVIRRLPHTSYSSCSFVSYSLFLFVLLFDRFKDTRVNDIWLVDVSLTLNTHTHTHARPVNPVWVHSAAPYFTSCTLLSGSSLAEVAAGRMGCRKERGCWQGACRLSSVCVISEWEVMHAGQSQGARRGFISEFVSGSNLSWLRSQFELRECSEVQFNQCSHSGCNG